MVGVSGPETAAVACAACALTALAATPPAKLGAAEVAAAVADDIEAASADCTAATSDGGMGGGVRPARTISRRVNLSDMISCKREKFGNSFTFPGEHNSSGVEHLGYAQEFSWPRFLYNPQLTSSYPFPFILGSIDEPVCTFAAWPPEPASAPAYPAAWPTRCVTGKGTNPAPHLRQPPLSLAEGC